MHIYQLFKIRIEIALSFTFRHWSILTVYIHVNVDLSFVMYRYYTRCDDKKRTDIKWWLLKKWIRTAMIWHLYEIDNVHLRGIFLSCFFSVFFVFGLYVLLDKRWTAVCDEWSEKIMLFWRQVRNGKTKEWLHPLYRFRS